MAGGCRRFLTRSTCSLRPNTNTCEVPGKESANTGVYREIVLPVIESGQAEIVDDEAAVGDREQKPLYGEHPKGYLILLATGRMMSLLVSEGRKAPQTDEERSAAYRSMVAYTGKYAVDCDQWTTRPDVAWNEAWLTNQVRTFKLDGNKLTVETAPALNPNFGKVVRVILVWQREE
jgi:hypothetical protein